jgi:hypothetical protein
MTKLNLHKMGWDIELYDNGVKVSDECVAPITNLTYNYSWWEECHEYWQPARDYDGKTIGEAIAIMEPVVTRMINEGIKTHHDYLRAPYPLPHLEDMLLWITTNYKDLILKPRHWTIKLV